MREGPSQDGHTDYPPSPRDRPRPEELTRSDIEPDDAFQTPDDQLLGD